MAGIFPKVIKCCFIEKNGNRNFHGMGWRDFIEVLFDDASSTFEFILGTSYHLYTIASLFLAPFFAVSSKHHVNSHVNSPFKR